MNRTAINEVTVKDNFAVAQVALYLFAILQAVVALMTATGAVPLGFAPQASTMLRLSTTTNAVVNILCFAGGYVVLARCLNTPTRLVWRVALCAFLINAGAAALSIAAQPNLYPVLTCSLALAGGISVWNGRGAVREYAKQDPQN
jgi:hypothetical protein